MEIRRAFRLTANPGRIGNHHRPLSLFPLRKIERSDILYGRRGNKIFRIKFNSRRRQYRNGRVCDFRRQLRLFPVARPNVDNQRGLSVSIKKKQARRACFFCAKPKNRNPSLCNRRPFPRTFSYPRRYLPSTHLSLCLGDGRD